MVVTHPYLLAGRAEADGMRTEDLAQHRTLMEEAGDCRRHASEALVARDPLAMKAWLDAMAAAMAAARVFAAMEAPDLDEALRDALPSILLPLHGGTVIGVSDDAETLQVKLGDGSDHFYRGSYKALVSAVRRGERVPLADAQLGRDEFDPVMVYIPPGWLGPIVAPIPGDEGDEV